MVVSERMQNIAGELATVWAGHPTTILSEVDSTNHWLKNRFFEHGSRHGAAVWADAQTAGRGRLGRQWESPPGLNIYTSLLLQPPKDRLSGILSLVAGLAVVRATSLVTGLDARMKWPNDGIVSGRKFCGILVEAGTEPNPWVVMGIGVNVRGATDPRYPDAVSLEQAAQRPLSREDIWVELMGQLEWAYESWLNNGNAWVAEQWAQKNVTLNQAVRVQRPGEDGWVGVAERVDPDGGLWVRTGDRLEKIIAGEVRLRLADGRYASDN